MSEESSQVPDLLPVRLTGSRAESAGNGDERAGSSGAEDKQCFGGDEWLMDADEEEAYLHQMMDVLETDAGENSHSNGIIDETQQSTKYADDGATRKISESEPVEPTGSLSTTREERKHPSAIDAAESKHKSGAHEKEGETSDGKARDDPKNAEIPDFMTPLRQYKGNYLWVSDLTSQAWCERQMLYEISFEIPTEDLKIEVLEKQAKTMKVGSDMHLKKELEVHVIKKIAVTSREDKWAIKCLNIISSVNQLLRRRGGKGRNSRCVVREMPIFGKPFQSCIFVTGVIDEIRYNDKDQLELVEFKTRSAHKSIPSMAQRNTHKLQVTLYKQLFDEAVCGQLSRQTVLDTIRLDPEATVNDEVAAHALGLGLELTTFGEILDATLERFQFLPKIDGLVVEYSSQEDEAPFAVDGHAFDPIWLLERLNYYNAYWEGKREVKGVDVEETWKCNHCAYIFGCDWRKKMHKKLMEKNAAKRIKIEITE